MNEQEKPQSTATVSVDVKVYPLEDKGNLKAFADVTLGECFAVKGVKVMEGEKGLFTAMPSRADANGIYHDTAYPINKAMHDKLNKAVVGTYQKEMEKAREPRSSSLSNLRQKQSEPRTPPQAGTKRPPNRGER